MCACVCVCVCTCVFVLRRFRMWFLSSEYIGQADFTDWMSFPYSNLIGEINPNPEALSANT